MSAILLLGTSLNPLAAQLLGPPFFVSTNTTHDKRYPAIAGDDAGRFLVVWETQNVDGSGTGVYGQQFDAQAVRVGSEFLVNNVIFSHQNSPSVASSGSNFIVAWDDRSDSLIHAQSYDAEGLEVGGEIVVNNPPLASSTYSDVAADAEQGLVVVWQQRYSGDRFNGRRFDSNRNPLGSAFPVSSGELGYVTTPRVAMNSSGGFVVAWAERSPGSGTATVTAQRFDAAGSPLGEQILVYLEATQNVMYAWVASDGPGNFVVVWERTVSGVSIDLLGQRFDASGTPQGDQFRVNTERISYIGDVAVAMDSVGRFIVVWGGNPAANGLVIAQKYSPGGEPLGGNFLVHTGPGDRRHAAVTLNDQGDIIVAYKQGWTICGQRLQNFSWIWSDGFEGGDTCLWSLTQGGACP